MIMTRDNDRNGDIVFWKGENHQELFLDNTRKVWTKDGCGSPIEITTLSPREFKQLFAGHTLPRKGSKTRMTAASLS